jgi:hypothetical protein
MQCNAVAVFCNGVPLVEHRSNAMFEQGAAQDKPSEAYTDDTDRLDSHGQAQEYR